MIRRGFLVSALSSVIARRRTAPRPASRFVTDWKAQAEHGGFYEALAEGLYAKHGLDVQIIREGGPDVNVPQLLAGGAADFGIGSNSFIPLNLVQGEHSHPRRDGDLPEGPAGADQPSAPRHQFAWPTCAASRC